MVNGIAYVQVVGVDTGDSAPSVLLFFDTERLMFNVPEGAQRLCTEHKVRVGKLSQIFLTQLAPRCVGGLFGMKLTLYDAGVRALSIHGPMGLKSLLTAAEPFSGRPDMKMSITEFAPSVPNPLTSAPATSSQSVMRAAFKSNNVTITALSCLIDPEHPHGLVAVTYVCVLPASLGKFNVQKAIALGVPKGPLFGQLQRGKSVIFTRNGEEVTVEPREVLDEPRPARTVIIVDAPTSHVLDQVTACLQAQTSAVELIVHMTPQSVYQTVSYQQWMVGLGPNTAHIVINRSHAQRGQVFRASTLHHAKLHMAHPTVFPKLAARHAQETETDMKSSGQVRSGEFLLKYMLGASRYGSTIDSKFDRREVLLPLTPTQHARATTGMYSDSDVAKLNEVRAMVTNPNSHVATEAKGKDEKLIFLGTGCAVPSKYRNVSSIIVQLGSTHEHKAIMMDCGEGTVGQLVRLLGSTEADEMILKIGVLYISHMHADHHLGVMSVLLRRQQLLQQRPSDAPQVPPLLIIGPFQLAPWLRAYLRACTVKISLDLYQFYDCQHFLVSTKPIPENRFLRHVDPTSCHMALKRDFGITSLQTVNVIHCRFAYGIVLSHASGWKMVYSGDTRPSTELEHFGADCTVLIHEATFASELVDEARTKRHSTIGQAIDSGIKMRAHRILLTHFSQRYPKFPVLDTYLADRTFYAFDFMSAKFSDLENLPKLCASLELLFPGEDEATADDIDKTFAPVPAQLGKKRKREQ